MIIAGTGNMIIRQATRADLPRLGTMGALLVELHHAFDSHRFLPTRQRMPADYAGFLSAELAKPDTVILVADEDGDVVGYAYATLEGHDYMALRGPAGVIQDIVVDPMMRGRGIGGALLERTMAELTSRDAPQIVLSTAARNDAAQRLFTRAGFHPTMIEMTHSNDEISVNS